MCAYRSSGACGVSKIKRGGCKLCEYNNNNNNINNMQNLYPLGLRSRGLQVFSAFFFFFVVISPLLFPLLIISISNRIVLFIFRFGVVDVFYTGVYIYIFSATERIALILRAEDETQSSSLVLFTSRYHHNERRIQKSLKGTPGSRAVKLQERLILGRSFYSSKVHCYCVSYWRIVLRKVAAEHCVVVARVMSFGE